jgi:hypothetical protein
MAQEFFNIFGTKEQWNTTEAIMPGSGEVENGNAVYRAIIITTGRCFSFELGVAKTFTAIKLLACSSPGSIIKPYTKHSTIICFVAP